MALSRKGRRIREVEWLPWAAWPDSRAGLKHGPPETEDCLPWPHGAFNLGDHSDLTKDDGAAHQPGPARIKEVWPQ